MVDIEQAVRDAAHKLHQAIEDAKAAGYRIFWPHIHDGLTSIAISETGAVKPPPPAIPTLSNPSPEPIDEE